jgi:energy-coupling factor transport system substrate-specific component
MHVEWVPAELAIALAALVLFAAPAPPARAADPSLRYLVRAQNGDGGFGGGPGQPSSQLLTGWTMIGLEAAGRNPLDVRRGGASPVDYTRARLGQLRDTGELERTILALEGAGVDASGFGGRDLVAELLRHRRADGSFEGQANWTAFGVMALRAAGRSARSATIRRSAAWLSRQQNGDGGFSFATRGGGSFVDETGAALQGLAAAGRRRGAAVTRALAYLRKAQNQDGGFGQGEGERSNAQSTAWAIQGIVAVHRDAGRFVRRGRSPLAFLASLRAGDGSYRYSRASTQTPVWVTAQALAAVRRKALPLKPPPRAKARHVRTARAPAPAARAARPHAARTNRRRPLHAAPARPAKTPRPVVTRPVSDVRHGASGSGGSALLPALGIAAAAALFAAAVAVAFRRRHV